MIIYHDANCELLAPKPEFTNHYVTVLQVLNYVFCSCLVVSPVAAMDLLLGCITSVHG